MEQSITSMARRDVDVHPVFPKISHTLYEALSSATFWSYYEHEDGIKNLVNAKVIDDFATMPPFTRLYLFVWDDHYDVEQETEACNENGVTVGDVMTAYCTFVKPKECDGSHHTLGGIDVKEIRDGYLVLEAALVT